MSAVCFLRTSGLGLHLLGGVDQCIRSHIRSAKLDVPPLSQVRREEVEVMDNDALLRGQCVDALYNPAFPLTITPPQRRGSP